MQGTELQRKLCAWRSFFVFQLTTYIYFLNPARRRRDGVNPALQSGRRDGVKEDYYAWKIDLFGFFPLGEQLQERRD